MRFYFQIRKNKIQRGMQYSQKFALCCIFVGLTTTMNYFSPINRKPVFVANRNWLAVNGSSCTIPEFHPMDPTVKRFFRKMKQAPTKKNRVAVVEGNVLRINRSAEMFNGATIHQCSYKAIYRPEVGSDDTVKFRPNVNIISDSIVLRESDDLLRVRCHSKSNKLLAMYHLTATIPRKDVEERCTRNRKQFEKEHPKVREQFNVVLFGVDSVSRANSIRHLKRTRDILLRQMDAVELKGYNKVGDNTLPNFIPLLTGKSIGEFYNGSARKTFVFGDNGFLWQRYSNAGYRTLYGEDAPQIATFNYLKRGFSRAPTDYYLRPLHLASRRKAWGGRVCNSVRECIRTMRKMIDWMSSFTETFSKQPNFSFTFSSGVTHDEINHAAYFDTPAFEFISRLRASGAFERNTILIVFSDHGIRFGPILNTPIGRLELNLPMMFIVMPVWFRKRYPLQWRRLKTNAGRLTTPYDIHATLLHALTGFDEASAPLTLHGRSLLAGKVPRNRTCDDASIPPIYCACHKRKILTKHDAVVKKAALATVDWINNQVALFGARCKKLRLNSIFSAALDIKSNGATKGTAARRTYALVMSTKPGKGMFESIVYYDPKNRAYEVFPKLNRLNTYGEDGNCLKDAVARKFCYCAGYQKQSTKKTKT